MDDLLRRVLDESRRLSELGKEAGYESFVQLVDLRDQLVKAIGDQELSDEHRRQLRKLQTYESVLLSHMSELLKEAEEGMRSIRTSKVQQQAYQQSAPYESMLFDKKR